jgi:16S rRNA (guanine(966)-N(2))-methyltransferase RsmD
MSLSITGGTFNGSVLRTPSGAHLTRPTSGKVRQALFNILRGRVEDARFIDLFAGSGAVGLEALSRGARKTVLVEQHPAAFKVLETNCRLLLSRGAEPAALEWLRQDARAYCQRSADRQEAAFDVVFADPPFGQDFSGLPGLLKPLLAPEGTAVVQFPTRNPPVWVATLGTSDRVLTYGESSLAVFGR